MVVIIMKGSNSQIFSFFDKRPIKCSLSEMGVFYNNFCLSTFSQKSDGKHQKLLNLKFRQIPDVIRRDQLVNISYMRDIRTSYLLFITHYCSVPLSLMVVSRTKKYYHYAQSLSI